jgi:hypothetical protein
MKERRFSAKVLDQLINEVTVDCYNEDEALTGFEVGFDEHVTFPVEGTVIGQPIRVLAVGLPNGRRELVASCQHGGTRYPVALLDIQDVGDEDFQRLSAAYRRWLGI